MPLAPLPTAFADTTRQIQRIATHVLARRRFEATGRFGLRSMPGGIATPMFGDDEVLRLGATALLRERRDDGARTEVVPLAGSTLRSLATAAGTSLDEPFSAGADAPAAGDPDAAIDVDPHAAASLLGWYSLGARLLDRMLEAHPGIRPSVVQLWPEHLDVAVDVAVGDDRVNLGFSPGDADHAEPYVYVGPWSARRPGDPDYWNEPFGAALGHAELRTAGDPEQAATAFLERGLGLLS